MLSSRLVWLISTRPWPSWGVFLPPRFPQQSHTWPHTPSLSLSSVGPFAAGELWAHSELLVAHLCFVDGISLWFTSFWFWRIKLGRSKKEGIGSNDITIEQDLSSQIMLGSQDKRNIPALYHVLPPCGPAQGTTSHPVVKARIPGRRYSWFLLTAVVMFYKVSVNTELVSTEPLLLGKIQS